ncbi:hypothetical protein [Rickettsia felis]|nr:hypothetical protein [Rickettsia felis]
MDWFFRHCEEGYSPDVAILSSILRLRTYKIFNFSVAHDDLNPTKSVF